MNVECSIVKDVLKGDDVTELRVKLLSSGPETYPYKDDDWFESAPESFLQVCVPSHSTSAPCQLLPVRFESYNCFVDRAKAWVTYHYVPCSALRDSHFPLLIHARMGVLLQLCLLMHKWLTVCSQLHRHCVCLLVRYAACMFQRYCPFLLLTQI